MNNEKFQMKINAIQTINNVIDKNNLVITQQLNRMQKLEIYHNVSEAIKKIDDKNLNQQMNQFYYELMKMNTSEIFTALSQLTQYLGNIN